MSAHEDQVRAFARYNRDFNARLYELLAAMPDEARKRDLGAFFGSIHGTLNHILLADRLWLGRFAKAFPTLASLERAELLQSFSSLRQELFADFDALREARTRTDDDLARWADDIDDALLAAPMRYRNSQGQEREHAAWIAVAHLFNHQTHHRGQVTALMHQLGVDPGVTDFLMYVG